MMPTAFGRYQIKEELGRGGMAIVYHAFDPRFKRDVALKILPREFLFKQTFRERFEREAQAIASLEHSAIVPVYDFGDEDGQPFFVMRFMPGGSLSDLIRERQLSLEEILVILGRIGDALDFAHRNNVIHRDVKPANILFDLNNDAYLADFGIVKLTENTSQLTDGGQFGTPAYMAPEISKPGGITSLIDVYALGVTLFQMLTGSIPYRADNAMGVMMAHATEPIPPVSEWRPDLPPVLQNVINTALAKAPEARYQTASTLARGLRAALRSAVLDEEQTLVDYDNDLEDETYPMEPILDDDIETIIETPAMKTLPRRSTSKAKSPRLLWFLIGGGIILLGIFGVVAAQIFSAAAETFEPTSATTASPPIAGAISESTEAISAISTSVEEESPSTVIPTQATMPPISYIGPIPSDARLRLGKGTINCIVTSPDGQYAAVGSSVGLYLYDLETFEMIWMVTTNSPVSSLAISNEGDQLAAGHANGYIVIRDIETKEVLQEFQGMVGVIASLAWSPDGETLAAASSGGTIALWDSRNGDESVILQGHTDGVLDLAWAQDNSTLASGSADDSVIIWDTSAGERLHTLNAHRNWVFAVEWALNDEALISGGFDGKVIIWNLDKEEPDRILEAHDGGVLDLDYKAESGQ